MSSALLSRKWQLVFGCAILAAAVAGCSAGGDVTAGVGTGGTGSLAKSVTGKVADGYLANATVFLDKNGNYQLDADEPATSTDQNGAYTLKVDAADLGKYPVVAPAIKGVTVDLDSKQTISASYVLSRPKESVSDTVSSNFISPITSQLRELMETAKYTSLQQASDALATNLGMPAGTDMTVDYIASNNSALHTAAQNIATLMGGQMAQVLGTSGSTMTVDVNRYRGMMGTIFSNLPSMSGTNTQSNMSDLNNIMTAVLSNTPQTSTGQPYHNMSTAFRGVMGGASTITGMMR